MSKISEQKALEAYPIKKEWVGNQYGGLEDINSLSREKYQEGYNQAMQDFMEKAELFFNYELYVSLSDQICSVNNFTSMSNFVEYFKNYMQDESENKTYSTNYRCRMGYSWMDLG